MGERAKYTEGQKQSVKKAIKNGLRFWATPKPKKEKNSLSDSVALLWCRPGGIPTVVFISISKSEWE